MLQIILMEIGFLICVFIGDLLMKIGIWYEDDMIFKQGQLISVVWLICMLVWPFIYFFIK